MILELDAQKEHAGERREKDAQHAAEDPRREKRSQDIERRRAGASDGQHRKRERRSGCSGPVYDPAEGRW